MHMKRQTWLTLMLVAFGLWSMPIDCFAHHLGQGDGSAPDVVDDYAHGASAQDDDAGGASSSTMGDEADEVGDNGAAGDEDDTNGPASEMGGEDTSYNGEWDDVGWDD
jgi:hypothetical protein